MLQLETVLKKTNGTESTTLQVNDMGSIGLLLKKTWKSESVFLKLSLYTTVLRWKYSDMVLNAHFWSFTIQAI